MHLFVFFKRRQTRFFDNIIGRLVNTRHRGWLEFVVAARKWDTGERGRALAVTVCAVRLYGSTLATAFDVCFGLALVHSVVLVQEAERRVTSVWDARARRLTRELWRRRYNAWTLEGQVTHCIFNIPFVKSRFWWVILLAFQPLSYFKAITYKEQKHYINGWFISYVRLSILDYVPFVPKLTLKH